MSLRYGISRAIYGNAAPESHFLWPMGFPKSRLSGFASASNLAPVESRLGREGEPQKRMICNRSVAHLTAAMGPMGPSPAL